MTAILLMAAVAVAGDTREDLSRKLETKVSLELRSAPLSEALEIFRGATGLNFVAVGCGDPAVSITVKDVSARSALRLLLAPRDLGAVFENGAVVVRDRKGLDGDVVLRVYDVRATVAALQDFPGADIGSVGASAICCLCITTDVPDNGVSPEFLADLVKASTGGRSWDENSRCSLMMREGLLYVTQTPRVHRDIQALLSRLRF